MMENSLLLSGLFLLIFFLSIIYFTRRINQGDHSVVLRRIRAFDALKGFTGRAIETGRGIHLALGTGTLTNETSADSLAGLAIAQYLADQAATAGVAPTVSMADPIVMLYAKNILQSAHATNPDGVETAHQNVRWIAPQPSAYAAGAMSLMSLDQTEANVMVGKFGDEYLLLGEAAARQGSGHIGGTSDPNTLPFIYASTEETLLGEEIYAAGAYLQEKPVNIGSLLAQDTMRWLIFLVIIGGIIATSWA